MKPFFRLLPILFALLLAPLCHARGAGEGTPTIPPESKLRAALQMIEALYVDSVDSSHLAEEAIIAMLRELDPHSLYSDPKETRALSEPLAGNFSGIGIRFQMLRDTVYVIETTPGGPSEKIGIVAGDRIISCNDTLVSGRKLKNTDILPILRGPKGSTAILKVKRARQTEPIIFKATRDDIPINSVDFAYMVNDSTGIISLARFAETSTDEFTDALKKLRRQGLKHLIIDLKDNGGGLLRQATDIANIFLHRGDTIVSTRSSKMEPAVYRAIHEGKFTDGRLVVIVNTYSA
ncbi:MAG: PDZ domain-containing protein, partial [Duncaniella sp.]|nr:PDZ domain-containing protein [Duncaniella sp.]